MCVILYIFLPLLALLRCFTDAFGWIIFEKDQGKMCPGVWGYKIWGWKGVGQVEAGYLDSGPALSPLPTHHTPQAAEPVSDCGENSFPTA